MVSSKGSDGVLGSHRSFKFVSSPSSVGSELLRALMPSHLAWHPPNPTQCTSVSRSRAMVSSDGSDGVLGSHRYCSAVISPSSVGSELLRALHPILRALHPERSLAWHPPNPTQCTSVSRSRAMVSSEGSDGLLGSHRYCSSVSSPIDVGMLPVRDDEYKLLPKTPHKQSASML